MTSLQDEPEHTDLGQTAWRHCPHVERDAEIMSGAWCFVGMLYPMYWVLGLTRREFDRLPVVVDLAGFAPFDAELVRRRLAYGRPRPDLEIDLPGAAVLGRFIAGSLMRLAVSGEGVDIELGFAAAPSRVGAARKISAHCAPTPRG